MKKEITVHCLSLVVFFIFIILFKQYFTWSVLFFILGGIVGTILPDIDHLIYIYFFAPQELTSQRVNYLINKREIWRTFIILANTRRQRDKLVFHSAFFQIIFLVLTLLVLSSSGNIFGRGLVLAFVLHLLVDQLLDLLELDSLQTWFTQPPVTFSLSKKHATLYWVGGLLFLLLFAFWL